MGHIQKRKVLKMTKKTLEWGNLSDKTSQFSTILALISLIIIEISILGSGGKNNMFYTFVFLFVILIIITAILLSSHKNNKTLEK